MPSKKALAKYLGISVNTVETAYSILVQEGYLRAVARSGFYVCKVDIPVGDRNFEYEEEQESVTAYKADFKTNKVDINSFPYSTWILTEIKCLPLKIPVIKKYRQYSETTTEK